MAFFADVILPLSLPKLYTYSLKDTNLNTAKKGARVLVPFRGSKFYTGIIYQIHETKPEAYEVKEIAEVLDDFPIVSDLQLELWKWIATYYMSNVGEVLRAAVPSGFLLQSETQIILNKDFEEESLLKDSEFLIFEALQHHPFLNLQQVSDILSKKNVLPIVKSLLSKNAVTEKEVVYEKYVPKKIKYLRLNEKFKQEKQLQDLLDELNRAPKQKEALLHFFNEQATNKKPLKYKHFINKYGLSKAVVNALVKKNIFEFYFLQQDRIINKQAYLNLPELSDEQSLALIEVNTIFSRQKTCLLYGITGSGKTAIYTHLIQKELDEDKQVLYLVPEIALTTQLIERLKAFFGEYISVFHSRFSMNERMEVYNNVLENKKKARLIIGARSAVLLPYQNIGLIIVDEEHEVSYKQFDPAPRYHARDTAMVLAKLHRANLILGTATPSVETYTNVLKDKYDLVQLHKRFGEATLPEISLVNMAEAQKKKLVKGHFSQELLTAVASALDRQEQVILFQNRRGYAPVVSCNICGHIPQCPDCDVSLTYHKFQDELRCHYCGYSEKMPHTCEACGSPALYTMGFGTQQIEAELKEFFPNYNIARMDLDTTRGKYDYYKIIEAFQSQEIDILVGTQMLSKGLDFSNVSLVGVLNADAMLYFPDFRAYERSFQMLVQVSGRAGRQDNTGKVIIQTHHPEHEILRNVQENDFQSMYEAQLKDRQAFKYPPYYRLIKITLKHKDYTRLSEASEWLATSLKNYFGDLVLGPATPSIARIRKLYIKNILVKLPLDQSHQDIKKRIQHIKNHFQSISSYRSIRFNIDVDYY